MKEDLSKIAEIAKEIDEEDAMIKKQKQVLQKIKEADPIEKPLRTGKNVLEKNRQ